MKAMPVLLLLLAGCAQVRSDNDAASGSAILINPTCLLICVGTRARDHEKDAPPPAQPR